jgi:hypothetical protein
MFREMNEGKTILISPKKAKNKSHDLNYPMLQRMKELKQDPYFKLFPLIVKKRHIV